MREHGVAVEAVTLLGGGARSEAVRRLAPSVWGLPVDVPTPGQYVADGAARQAAWVLSGGSEPPVWELSATERFEAEATPEVMEQYAVAATLVAERSRAGG